MFTKRYNRTVSMDAARVEVPLRLLLYFYLMLLVVACLSVVAMPAKAQTYTSNVNSTAFPLSSNQLFPARNFRTALKCFNPLSNHAVTITYSDGFSFIIQPGGSLWEVAPSNLPGRVTSGIVSATGTAAETLPCEEVYVN